MLTVAAIVDEQEVLVEKPSNYILVHPRNLQLNQGLDPKLTTNYKPSNEYKQLLYEIFNLITPFVKGKYDFDSCSSDE